MISFANIPHWTETLGWTLLNSLWQSALVMLLVIFVLRILPQRFSKIRYAIACAGFVIVLISSACTFLILNANNETQGLNEVAYFPAKTFPAVAPTAVESSRSSFNHVVSGAIKFIDNNMSWILLAWSVGALAFSLRLISGWWFISALKSSSSNLSNEWSEKLQMLANDLGMEKIIQLAESTRITTPMVIGLFKPIVLVPAGMLAGLSSSQIETIFLHELAHIRRHDYLINLVQVFVETIFFFNPFVWILSNIVRREREYCCDDDVVSIHGSSLDYAKALAQLEEWKLTKSTFGLALAANKNQLLHRIKRIMEKTGEKYSAKDRFIPAVMLIVGLVCASWLTVQKNQNSSSEENYNDLNSTFSQDTTIKKGKSSRTTIITFDEDGQAHEQIFEEAEGDTDVAFWMSAPPTPSADFAIPPMPAFPSFPAFPEMSADVWGTPAAFPDTIPGAWFKGSHNWEEFSQDFEKKFSEEFSEFYKIHQKDFDKMMKEMEKKFKSEFDAGDFHGLRLLDAQHIEELAHLESIDARHQVLELAELRAAEAVEIAELARLDMAPALAGLEAMSADLAKVQGNLELLNGQMEEFNKGLNKMLIEDGYLKKDEELKTINWDNNKIEINGKKIKDSDRKKYQDHHDKFWDFVPNRVE